MFVYISEAHAKDEWQLPDNEKEGIVFNQPQTWRQRREVAERCGQALKLDFPCVVDEMDNRVDNQYAGWPERLFIIDGDGRIAYAGKQGPWGFKPKEVERWLRRYRPGKR